MTPGIDRHAIIEHLKRDMPRHECFRAAWLGGSDAMNRADDLSDVDVFILAAKGKTEEAISTFESIVESLTKIRLRYRLPMPTWHGFEQAFYQLEGAPEHLMIDWLVAEPDQENPWLEIERHGRPIVLFDKGGYVKPRPIDRSKIEPNIELLSTRFQMFRHLPTKLAMRGRPIDAMHFYQALVMKPLVDLLRAVYCPDRHDYGFRYLEDDLPREIYATLCRLMFVPSIDAIPGRVIEASELFKRACATADEATKKRA